MEKREKIRLVCGTPKKGRAFANAKHWAPKGIV